MSRRLQLQRDATVDVAFYPTIESKGRVFAWDDEPSSEVNEKAWTLYGPDGIQIDNGTYSVDNSEADDDPTILFSRIVINDFEVDLDLGRNYRLEFEWRELIEDLDPESTLGDVQTYTLWFDVVRQKWVSSVSLGALERLVPHIGLRIEKQRSVATHQVATLEAMAAQWISEAMDLFFVKLAAIVRENKIESYAALVPDNARFDAIVSRLALSLIYGADADSPESNAWFHSQRWMAAAMELFGDMTMIEYDEDDDGIVDGEVRAPFRPKATFEELAED